MEITRQEIRELLDDLDLGWGVDEDADVLIDILLESYDLHGAYIWLLFYDDELDGVPIALLENGRTRQVFRRARRLAEMGAAEAEAEATS